MKQTTQKVSREAAKLMKYPGKLTQPLPNIENLTAGEVFVMMCNRIESMTIPIRSVAASALSQDQTPAYRVVGVTADEMPISEPPVGEATPINDPVGETGNGDV